MKHDRKSTMNMQPGEPADPARPYTDDAKESLSAYMDGELPAGYRDGLLADFKADDGLRDHWGIFHCIGDVLRSSDMGCHSSAFQRDFSVRLEAEPYLFAPEGAKAVAAHEPAARRAWRMPAAIAAGVAAIAVTGAAVMLPQRAEEGVQTAQPAAAIVPAAFVSTGAPPAGSESDVRPVSNEYLAAHRYYSNGLAMQGVVSHVRTAGYDGK